MIVVDDALLLAALAERIPASVPVLLEAAADGEVFTTGMLVLKAEPGTVSGTYCGII